MHFDGVVMLVLAYGFRVYGLCLYCVVLCMCKAPTFMNVLSAKHAELTLNEYIQCAFSSTSVIVSLCAQQFDCSYSYFMQL